MSVFIGSNELCGKKMNEMGRYYTRVCVHLIPYEGNVKARRVSGIKY